jgi:hypothetical protein
LKRRPARHSHLDLLYSHATDAHILSSGGPSSRNAIVLRFCTIAARISIVLFRSGPLQHGQPFFLFLLYKRDDLGRRHCTRIAPYVCKPILEIWVGDHFAQVGTDLVNDLLRRAERRDPQGPAS